MAHGTRHRQHAIRFDQSDLPDHMLGMTKSRPRLGNWFVFAVLTGTVLALVLVVLGNLIF